MRRGARLAALAAGSGGGAVLLLAGACGMPLHETSPREPPLLFWATPGATTAESAGVFRARLRIAYDAHGTGANREIVVPFTIASTGDGRRWRAPASPLRLPPGHSPAALELQLIDDAVAQPAETLTITLEPPRHARLPAPGLQHAPHRFILTITDDDPQEPAP